MEEMTLEQIGINSWREIAGWWEKARKKTSPKSQLCGNMAGQTINAHQVRQACSQVTQNAQEEFNANSKPPPCIAIFRFKE